MSVTQYYERLGDEAVEQFRRNPDTFCLEDCPDCESVQAYGQECLLVEDLAAQATTGASEKKLVSGAVSGFAGESVFANGNHPFLIDRVAVAVLSRLLDQIRPDDLRRVCNLGILKARYLEVEDWLWESWGPNVFDERLLPTFEMIRGMYHRAAQQNQHVIVGWF